MKEKRFPTPEGRTIVLDPYPQPETELRRRECEARHYLEMSGEQRIEALKRIEDRRGQKGAELLAQDMRALRRGEALT